MKYLIKIYIDWLRNSKRKQPTINLYEKEIINFINWIQQEKNSPGLDVTTIKNTDITGYYQYLLYVLGNSQATINKKVTALKNFFKFAKETGYITHDPTDHIKITRTAAQYSPPTYVSDNDFSVLIKTLKLSENKSTAARNIAECTLMYRAGLKVSEVTNLRKSNLNMTEPKPHINLNNRTIPLEKKLVEALNEWLIYRGELTDNDYVFVSRTGGKIKDLKITSMISQYAKKAGLNNVNPQNLRHSYAKYLVEIGTPPSKISKLLGINSKEYINRYID